ncbi:MAG: hypothetical protein ACREH4_11425, partial [Vitreimonas sp.]
AGLNGEAWMPPLQSDEELPRAAQRALRAELIALGAQAVTVDAQATSAGQEAARVLLTARWREPAASSPEVVRALAQRFPHWRVERLTLTRGDPVSAELAVAVSVRAAPQQEASR